MIVSTLNDIQQTLIRSPERYIFHFLELGFDEALNDSYEEGVTKIAIFINTSRNHFMHVSRQLTTGKWASKLGDWEDIEHDIPEDLLGFYGDRIIYMEKRL